MHSALKVFELSLRKQASKPIFIDTGVIGKRENNGRRNFKSRRCLRDGQRDMFRSKPRLGLRYREEEAFTIA